MYNYSYSTLFPKPYCAQCGYGYDNSGQCVSYDKYQKVLQNAALYTSGNCPYGHIQLPGQSGCTSLLAGAFRAPEESAVVNGQLVQIQPRRNTNICNVCDNGNNLGCSSCY
jgi:hypothetical protein